MTQPKQKIKIVNNDSKCIVCCEKLIVGAKKCTHCGSYQTALKNMLSYAAGVVGLLSAVGAVLIYFASELANIKKEFFWEDKVAIYEYAGDSHIVMSNFGDGPVFVKGVNLRFESGAARYFEQYEPLNVTIENNTVKRISLSNENNSQNMRDQFSEISLFESIEDYKVADNFSGTFREVVEGQKCYLRNITEKDSNWIKTVKRNMGEKFYTSEGIGTIEFYSVKTGSLISTKFNVQSFLKETKNMGCKLIYKNEFGKSIPLVIK